MRANAMITLESPTPCTVIRRLETDTDPVDEEVGAMYEVVLSVYEDEITTLFKVDDER
jgi:hypothetical protein